MTIKQNKLVLSPPLQQSIIDPVTHFPAVGTLYFTSVLTQKPKPVYLLTGDTKNPYQATTQITLNGAGALPQPMYFYPFDEKDSEKQERYNIELKNTKGHTIFSLSNFPLIPNLAADTLSTIQNLCPSYGFNSPIHPTDFSEQNGQPFNQTYNWCLKDTGTPIAYGWNLWAGSSADYKLYYEFQQAPTQLPNNPQYELFLTVQDAQPTATSFVRLGCKLGAYNAFQGKTLRLSHYLHWLNSQPFSPINILFMRTKGGEIEPPVSLGVLTTGETTALQQAAIIIPTLSHNEGYTCDDVAFIYLDFPKGVDFKIGITANWYQQDCGNLVPFEYSHGNALSGAFFGSWTSIGDSCLHQDQAGLPTAFCQGQFSGLNKTGEIVLRLKGSAAPNYAVELNGAVYYWGDFVDGTGVKINRVAPILSTLNIDFKKDFTQPLFYSNLKANTFDMGLKNGEFKTLWDASGAPTITLTKAKDHNPYDIKITRDSDTEATLKYIYNWHPNEGIVEDWPCGSRPFYQHVAPIHPGPIGNWYDSRCPNVPYGNRKIIATIIEHGSKDKPPEVKLTFTSKNVQDYASYFAGASIRGYYRYANFIEIPTQEYGGHRARPYYRTSQGPGHANAGAVHIVFTGDQTSRILPGKRSTLNINLKGIESTKALLHILVAQTGGGDAYNIKVNALPHNGDVLRFSNNKYNYAVLFHQTGLSFPIKPSDVERTLTFHFNANMNVNDFTKALAVALQRWIVCIPTASDLGFNEAEKKYTHWLTL